MPLDCRARRSSGGRARRAGLEPRIPTLPAVSYEWAATAGCRSPLQFSALVRSASEHGLSAPSPAPIHRSTFPDPRRRDVAPLPRPSARLGKGRDGKARAARLGDRTSSPSASSPSGSAAPEQHGGRALLRPAYGFGLRRNRLAAGWVLHPCCLPYCRLRGL